MKITPELEDKILFHIGSAAHFSDLLKKIGLFRNGKTMDLLREVIQKHNIDISHFNPRIGTPKYTKKQKICPVCSDIFEVLEGAPKQKIVCSRACSNTYFRSGENNGNYKYGGWILVDGDKVRNSEYRTICFKYWPEVCAVPGCDWYKVIEVHHVDYNHHNNDIRNLIPLCPNHHDLLKVAKYKKETEELIHGLIKEKFQNIG